MPAHASAAHESSPPVKISSRSFWSDHEWHLDGMRPGWRGYLLRIDWSFDLPDGSRFTDPQWAAWLEDTRRFLWSMRVDPPFGRERMFGRRIRELPSLKVKRQNDKRIGMPA